MSTVQDETQESIGDETHRRFLTESTREDPLGRHVLAEDLYGLYLTWCSGRDIPPQSAEAFHEAMKTSGLARTRRAGASVYSDIAMTGPDALMFIVETVRPAPEWNGFAP
jgi:hypothetical protein